MPHNLPIIDCLPEVVAAIEAGRPVILRAPPGAGKTTGVPPALLASDCLPEGKILLLQPRRIAARAAAHRLSQLAGESLGSTYGYHVRFDRKLSRSTRLVAMTTGILLRQLTHDPLLEDVHCVIFDEFHERSLEMDLALGMLHRIRTTLRPELRMIVMSATLDTQPVQALIKDAVTIESLGRAYDVDIRYDDSFTRQTASRSAAIAARVSDRITEALGSTSGDLLVFLPGVGEIHQTADRIQDVAESHDLRVCKLYGDLSPAAQDAVLSPSPERKIVLATNIAETSITIPGITCVIDSGLARVLQHDTSVGVPCLRLEPISKASADQRAGRAGRTAPGVCFRLWPRALHSSRPDHTFAEVARADLSAAILTLAAWGERDVRAFPWVTPPTDHAVQAAKKLLVQLGAVDEQLVVTQLGRQMNRLPIHPRLARLMIAAEENHCMDEAALAAAVLSERDPFDRSCGTADSGSCQSDLINRVVRLQRHDSGQPDHGIHSAAAKNISRVAKQLRRTIDRKSRGRAAVDLPGVSERLSRALLAAYPDRLAKRRSAGSTSGLMVGGRGVKLDRSSTVRTSELFLCVSVDGEGEEARVRIASAVEEDWLPEEQLVSKREMLFHPTLKSVVARVRRYFLDLLISEAPIECPADEESALLLFQHAEKQLTRILPAQDKSLHSFIARWRFLSEQGHSSELPADIDAALRSVLRELCRTRTSFKELSRAPWLEYLKAMFGYEQLQWFDQQAPESIVVPSGNRIRIDYRPGKPPILAVRIQEIYGWKQTPRLASGKTSLQLHLLGPNHRPQQITDDLQSFWETTYSTIKKELKRRYAKHHWPDDPQNAVATANGLKPRSGK
jgi:ATP-dependent helicase HrpB